MKLPAEAKDERLDRAVTALLKANGYEVSVREVRDALKAGLIRVGGQRRAPATPAPIGDELDLSHFVPRSRAIVAPEPAAIARVSILFEDQSLIALNKPSGMPVAPQTPNERGTLLGAVIALAPEVARAGPPLEGGLGHRLDVETSGVVVFARDPDTRLRVRAAFSANEVDKRYHCLVHDPSRRWTSSDTIEAPLSGRGARVRVSSIEEGGLTAETSINPTGARQDELAWLEARPRTGRRHQIRVHLASAGTPIVSDPVYGVRHPAFPRLALHARSIVLLGRPEIIAPLPADLREPLLELGFGVEVIEP